MIATSISGSSKAETTRLIGITEPTLARVLRSGAASMMVAAKIERWLGVRAEPAMGEQDRDQRTATAPRRKRAKVARSQPVHADNNDDFEGDLEFDRGITAGLLDCCSRFRHTSRRICRSSWRLGVVLSVDNPL